ncbi:MAG: hypothetical protein ACKOSQ_09725 [Planctomycetaceae bacterium]
MVNPQGGSIVALRVIARIPDVSPPAETTAPRGGVAAAPRRPVPRRLGGVLARIGDAFPTWSVAVLAVIAVMVWVAASRNDQARLQRQRDAVRLAREPLVSPAIAPARPASGGAVVR